MKLRFGWGPIDGAAGMQKNVALLRTVRETVGDDIDIMADAYMGWNLDYARRMIPLTRAVPSALARGSRHPRRHARLRVAQGDEPGARSPAASTASPSTGSAICSTRAALDYIQFDTNRVGGITQARKIAALAEAHSVPVVPHAGQMHNYHIVMASLNSPMAEFFPPVDVEIGNELFWYIFDGEPTPEDGYINLRDDVPGLGLTIKEEGLKKFDVIE